MKQPSHNHWCGLNLENPLRKELVTNCELNVECAVFGANMQIWHKCKNIPLKGPQSWTSNNCHCQVADQSVLADGDPPSAQVPHLPSPLQQHLHLREGRLTRRLELESKKARGGTQSNLWGKKVFNVFHKFQWYIWNFWKDCLPSPDDPGN